MKFDRTTKSNIIKRYLGGERAAILAKEFDISVQTLYSWTTGMKKNNYKTAKREIPKMTGPTEEEIRKFNEGRERDFLYAYNKNGSDSVSPID